MASYLTVDDDKCLPKTRSFRSDHGSFAPSSPTDTMMSPCSKRLWGPKRMHSPDLSKELKRDALNLDNHIFCMPFPYPDVPLVLGTSSKGRQNVIDRLGWKYTQISPDIDEKAIRDEDPLVLPLLIAQAKAVKLTSQLSQLSDRKPCLIITADQVVLFERTVREKPVDLQEARAFLSSYSDKCVSTVSAVVLTHYPSGITAGAVDVSTVFWDKLPSATVDKVLAQGKVLSCAGGFMVEDEDLQGFVKSIDGSIDGVMGMPVQLTLDLMDEVMGQLQDPSCPLSPQA